MNMIAKSRKLALTTWLLVCPVMLAAAVFVLPQFNQLYGTPTERYTLLALMVLPLAGVIGILRHMRSTLPVRIAVSAGYLIAGRALALFVVIFIGCSWAGACF